MSKTIESTKTPSLPYARPGNIAESPALTKALCARDIQAFALRFFPRHTRLPWSQMHLQLLDLYKACLLHPCSGQTPLGTLSPSSARPILPPIQNPKSEIQNRMPRRLAVIAPRTAAKSTLKSLILPIHSLLYQQERYIILISATMKQAKQRLRNLKSELLRNERLISVYKEELTCRDGWTTVGINVNGVQIDAFSAGTEIRGISYREWRPTLVILDDVEEETAVYSSDYREKIRNWYNETIEHIGDKYTAIEVIGTLLHPDSLLAHLSRRPDFQTLRFSSILRFADRSDLWEQWRSLYTNLSDEHRAQRALQFYISNQRAMLQGHQVLWPEQENYYDLQCQLTTRGRRAFFKEKQNEPTLVGEVFFDPARATRFRLQGDTIELLPGSSEPQFGASVVPPSGGSPRQPPTTPTTSQTFPPQTSSSSSLPLSSLKIAGFLDTALGKPSRSGKAPAGDYAAIATVGIDKSGYLYLLDVWLKRCAPTVQVNQIFNLHNLWNYCLFGIESNCFQGLLRNPIEQTRQERKACNLPWQLPIREVHHSQNKDLRIATLEPLITNGWLRLNAALPEAFWQQLESFPNSEHDDALDALEGAVSIVRGLNMGEMKTSGVKRLSIDKLRHF